MNQDRKGVRGLVRWHWYHRKKSTCGNSSQTPFSLLRSTLLVFKQPITHLVKRWCGQSLSFRPECDMVQSVEIGEHDFGQLPTFESSYASNDSKLQNMFLINIQHLYSKDSASKVCPNSRSYESGFLGATVTLMIMKMSASMPWCKIRATRWIANSSGMNLSSLIRGLVYF